MIDSILYSFNKQDYFKYVFFMILLFISLLHINIFNINNIIPFVITFIIMYIAIKFKVKNEYNKMHRANELLKYVQINKYPNLNVDSTVLKCIYELKYLSYKSRIKFISFIKSVDNFFNMYNISKRRNLRPTDIYDSAKSNAIKSLNILKQFAIDIDKYPYLDKDRTISNKNYTDTDIHTCREILKNRFSVYLTMIEQNINKDWYDGDVNIYTVPVYNDDPEPFKSNSNTYDLY